MASISQNIIGRNKEIDKLRKLYSGTKAEFVAIYGRRRVGKTFLVDEALKGKITFRHAGLSPIDQEGKANNVKKQLQHFYQSLLVHGLQKGHCPKNWLEAFFMLEMHLQQTDNGKRQVIFLDELPWLDTPRSGFLTAFESFWNSWACHRNVMLIVCGSANSWILDKLINNHGGLYGRTTCQIKLSALSLEECEKFYKSRDVRMSRYDIAQANMILGGIPYYMNYLDPENSLPQNINAIFFENDAPLKDEFVRLFESIFTKPEEMMQIVHFLATKRCGFKKEDIVKHLHLIDNGELSKQINALIASDFVDKYVPFGESKRTPYFKLVDPFCLFYLRFVAGRDSLDSEFWMHAVHSQSINNWRGYAFEDMCLRHIKQIKYALQIGNVSSTQSAWAVAGNDNLEGTQIDLLIRRDDNVVNLCEMKFYSEEFVVNKNYHKTLVHRANLLFEHLSRKEVIHPILVTTYGLTRNEYSSYFVNCVTLDYLFAK